MVDAVEGGKVLQLLSGKIRFIVWINLRFSFEIKSLGKIVTKW